MSNRCRNIPGPGPFPGATAFFSEALNVLIDASAFSGNLDSSVINTQLLANAVDALALGKVIAWDVSSLAADTTTTDLTSPPTVVLHSFPYSKQSATSNLVVMSTTAAQLNVAGSMRTQAFVDAVGLKGAIMKDTAGAANATTVLIDEVAGLAVGSRTVGVKWSVNAGTATCSAAATYFYQCTIVVLEVEP